MVRVTLDDELLAIGVLLHTRMMELRLQAQAGNCVHLADAIEQVKLELANRIFAVTLMLQMGQTTIEIE